MVRGEVVEAGIAVGLAVQVRWAGVGVAQLLGGAVIVRVEEGRRKVAGGHRGSCGADCQSGYRNHTNSPLTSPRFIFFSISICVSVV